MKESNKILEKLKAVYPTIFETLNKPRNMAMLQDAIKEYLTNHQGEDILFFLVHLANVGINYNYLHRFIMDLNLINLYDAAIERANIYGTPLIKSPYSLLFDRIDRIEDKDELVSLLDACEIDNSTRTYLYNSGVHNYSRCIIGLEDNSPLEEGLKKKLNIYFDVLHERKENELKQTKFNDDIDYLYDAKAVIIEFISGEYLSKEEYCKEHDINTKYFEYLLSIIKEYLPDYYKLYENYIDQTRSVRYKRLESFIKSVNEGLTYGVQDENGNRYPLDIIDYYLMGGINYKRREKDVLEVARTILDNKSFYYFDKLIKKLTTKSSTNPNNFLYNLSLKYEDNGEVKELSREELELIVEGLKENRIPVNQITCTYAIRRYTRGTRDFIVKKESTITE